MPAEATTTHTPEDAFRGMLRAIVRHDKTPPYAVGEPSAVGDPAPEGGRWLTPAEHAGIALQQTIGLALLTDEERALIKWALRTCPMPDPDAEWQDAEGKPADAPDWAWRDEPAFAALVERIGALK
jgi:hypothetical protein